MAASLSSATSRPISLAASQSEHGALHEVVGRYHRIRGVLAKSGFVDHCGLRHAPHNDTVLDDMLTYANHFVSLAPGGTDPSTKEGEAAEKTRREDA